MKGGFRTLSNALSLLRILLVIPISASLALDTTGGRNAALLLIIAAAATDYLDGYFARKKGEVTELGKILDPVADKVAVGAVGLILAAQGKVPVWFLTSIVVRDLMILAGGYYLTRKKSLILQSSMLGEWAAGALALTLFAAAAGEGTQGAILPVLLLLSTVMLAASLTSYGVRFFSAVSTQQTTNR